MDTARYIIALIVIVVYPPAIAFWLIVHPTIAFWRKLGPTKAYAMLVPALLALGWGMYAISGPLLAVEFGTQPWLWPLVIILYGASAYIEVRCRKHLKLSTLVGVPELSEKPGRDKLLTEGIYSRVRHPRYVGAVLGAIAVAFLANYLAVYVLAALIIPALYVIVVLEEKEMRDRFGAEYLDYSERVPRFIPKLG